MSFKNYDDVVAQLRSGGLDVDHLKIGTMKPVRCREIDGDRQTRGWYILAESYSLEKMPDGNVFKSPIIVGSYGVFHGPSTTKFQITISKDAGLTDDQKEAIKIRHNENIKRMRGIQEADHARAAARAAKAWKSFLKEGTSDYLIQKSVKAYGIRFSPSDNGTIAVPISDAAGIIHGLQIIRSGNKTGHLQKEYWPKGLAKKGHFHLMGAPRDIVLIAEGYATGATLHEATSLPVVVAFDAGNLLPVAQEIKRRWPYARILICADDDFLTPNNPGVTAAQNAALAVNGGVAIPHFPIDRGSKKLTDWNDLSTLPEGGIHLVSRQIEEAIKSQGFDARPSKGRAAAIKGGGVNRIKPILPIEEAVLRYTGIYGAGGRVLYDEIERRLVHKDDVLNLLPPRSWDLLKGHADWRVVYDYEVGFDPAGEDSSILCNLYSGLDSIPKEGSCIALLDLLRYLCSMEPDTEALYEWILKWLAYPLQNPGAKMATALVIHGPQGTGKSRFFEAVAKIYGRYSVVIGQEALEDKFNADWVSAKLFVIGDEVQARSEMYHSKNRLKSYITSPTVRVNPKNLPARQEKNHMNLVFLSNEVMPLVLERDDRRYVVIWVPPKLSQRFFDDVNDEIKAGGIQALHHHLMSLDLGDFNEHTKPPLTRAKMDLQELGKSSEERFLNDWCRLEIDGPDGDPIPLCPCLGSDLYKIYERWCEIHGERRRSAKDLISFCGKTTGWSAGESLTTWFDLNNKTYKNRKMVIPSDVVISESLSRCATGRQEKFKRERYETKAEWMTVGYTAFRLSAGIE